MKKLLVLFCILLLSCILLLTTAVVLANNGKDEEKNPLQLIFGKLVEILEQLKIIAQKETIVNVEPPEVNVEVNPNITLPEKECKWERLNQKIDLDFEGVSSGWRAIPATKYIGLPDNQKYKEMIIKNMIISHSWDYGGKVLVNDEKCFDVSGGGSRKKLIENPCNGLFINGINKIEIYCISGGSDCSFNLYDMTVEMEIKPANC